MNRTSLIVLILLPLLGVGQVKKETMAFNKLIEHSVDNLGEGTDILEIEKLEKLWNVNFPEQFRVFLLEIGYAEIYGDEIYSIYEVPDETPCLGLHWMNKDNKNLEDGFIKFFSNDIDGEFYIHSSTGIVFLNSTDTVYAETFEKFIDKIIND